MKRKELIQLARKIASQELIIQTSTDPHEIKKAQNVIIELSGHVNDLGDMMEIDDIVQELLNNKIDKK